MVGVVPNFAESIFDGVRGAARMLAATRPML
jgi:hypothetical protein